MFVRKLVGLITLVAFGPIALGACGTGHNAASSVLKTPELPTDKQAKCRIAKSQAEPLIVEWPDAARGRLESMSRKGLVAVRYEGCELEVLSHCSVKTNGYGYAPITRKQSIVTIRDEDDLYASMPVGAVKLEGKLKTAGQLNVNMTIVGRYETPTHRIYRQDLDGDCSQATHVIAALTVGAFTFSAGADAEVGGGVTVGGAGGGGKSTAARETIQRDGEEGSCKVAGLLDKSPPEGCGALLQIEVMPLAKGAKSSVEPSAVLPTPPSTETPKCKRGERIEDGVCVRGMASTVKPPPVCSAGQHESNGRCVDDEPTPPPPLECPNGSHPHNGACVVDNVSHNDTPRPFTPGPSTPPDDEGAMRPNPLRTIFAYGAVAGGLAAVTLGGIALGKAKDAKDACTESTQTCGQDYEAKKKSAVTYGILTDVALGLTVLSVVGIFLVPAKVKVGVAPTPGGVAGSFGGQF